MRLDPTDIWSKFLSLKGEIADIQVSQTSFKIKLRKNLTLGNVNIFHKLNYFIRVGKTVRTKSCIEQACTPHDVCMANI